MIRPILFNTEMVQAVLDGRKTATRRKIDIDIANQFDVECDGKTVFAYINQETGDCYSPTEICRYRPGDILYVRETWQYLYELDGNEQIIEGTGRYYYMATDSIPYDTYVDLQGITHEKTPWRPSIHMPKAATRIWLKVKEIRIERLQDIDDDGVVAEGLRIGDPYDELWNSTIKKKDLALYGWDANPWVWVIEFERCEKPEGWCA